MTNQHARLSQTLAAQHTTELREQATRQRRRHGLGRPHLHTRATRRWWQPLDRQASPRPS
jgi:hypothetical protein